MPRNTRAPPIPPTPRNPLPPPPGGGSRPRRHRGAAGDLPPGNPLPPPPGGAGAGRGRSMVGRISRGIPIDSMVHIEQARF
eukprot:gene21665-biopygen11685